MKRRVITKFKVEAIERLIKEGLTHKEIAARVNMALSLVKSVIRKNGLHTREYSKDDMPGMLVSSEDMARLYAGVSYENKTEKEFLDNRMPSRLPDIGQSNISTAQLCIDS